MDKKINYIFLPLNKYLKKALKYFDENGLKFKEQKISEPQNITTGVLQILCEELKQKFEFVRI